MCSVYLRCSACWVVWFLAFACRCHVRKTTFTTFTTVNFVAIVIWLDVATKLVIVAALAWFHLLWETLWLVTIVQVQDNLLADCCGCLHEIDKLVASNQTFSQPIFYHLSRIHRPPPGYNHIIHPSIHSVNQTSNFISRSFLCLFLFSGERCLGSSEFCLWFLYSNGCYLFDIINI